MLEAGRIAVIEFELNEMNVVSRVFMKDFLAILPNYRIFRLLPEGAIREGAAPVDIPDYRGCRSTELRAFPFKVRSKPRNGARGGRRRSRSAVLRTDLGYADQQSQGADLRYFRPGRSLSGQPLPVRV